MSVKTAMNASKTQKETGREKTNWNFEPMLKNMPKLHKPILLVGLPGIGNVGKIAADFIIEDTNAKPLYNVFSHTLPNSVFINDDNLVELPEIAIYYKKRQNGESANAKKEGAAKKGNGAKLKNDLLILTGDVQPSEEQNTYDFCDDVLEKAKRLGLTKVITLGGIGLAEAPQKPAIYCTGNSKQEIESFIKGIDANKNLYGTVGPIIGVSGVMIGLAARKEIPALCVLSETLGHPAYLGLKGARELVKALDKKLGLNIRLKNLDKEIKDIESEMEKTEEGAETVKAAALKKLKLRRKTETSYIG